jgi:hypothetical protein
MNSIEQWQQANDNYLASALGWLRHRLESHAAAEPGPDPHSGAASPPTANVPAVVRKRSWLSRRAEPMPVEVTPEEKRAMPLHSVAVDTTAWPTELAEAGKAENPPALITLARRLGLTEFERDVLLLCVAMEFDTRIAGLCARAQRDLNHPHPYPTFALALTLFDHPAWDVMSPERPLRYWRLVEINQPGAQPLVTSVLKADERIVNYLKGLNYLDDRLAPLMMQVAGDASPLPPSQASFAEAIAQHLQHAKGGTPLPVFQLLGTDSQSKLAVARQAAASLGLTLYRVAANALPTLTSDHETFVRLWQRETALLPIALYVDAAQVDRAGSPQAAAVQRLTDRLAGVLFLDSREAWAELGRDTITFEIAKPTPVEQRAAWLGALGQNEENQAARLAGQFNFNLPTIRAISANALAGIVNGDIGASLWADCLGHARPALDQLAQVIDPKASWEDLEVPVTEKSLLHQITEQVNSRMMVYDGWGFRERMNRGLGISVLFAGESGTGKTMAAEVIANELKLLLYRIDLSAVVSKYIGETEKNLRKLFDASEDGGAILFFDEADALFGKRSEVKDSHDRYANIEINYLLQRMEAYRGLAILATNMKAALDNAFLRRLRFIVNFPFPGPNERRSIWQKVFPPQTPTTGLDFHRLARLNLTGGSIRNIALNAAFLAARVGAPVTMPLVLDAARTEFKKLERPINEADFHWLKSVGGTT